jgi:hypothetical protein
MQPGVSGSESKNATAPWPRRHAKRLDSGAVRKRGSEFREAKQVYTLTEVGL